MKVLIIVPVTLGVSTDLPWDAGCMATIAAELGHKVGVVDASAYGVIAETLGMELSKDIFDVVAVVAGCRQYLQMKEAVKVVKETQPDALIVLAGELVSTVPEVFDWTEDAEVAVIGDYNKPWMDVLDAVFHKRFNKIRGLAYRDQGKVKRTGPAIRSRGFDLSAFPLYNLLPMEVYKGRSSLPYTPDSIVAKMRIPMRTETPYWFGDTYRMSAHSVIAHATHLRLKYALDFVNFLDEGLLADHKRAKEIFNLWIKEGFYEVVKFSLQADVTQIDIDILRVLKDAGCSYIQLGYSRDGLYGGLSITEPITQTRLKAAIDACRTVRVEPIVKYTIGRGLEEALETAKMMLENPCQSTVELAQPDLSKHLEDKQRVLEELARRGAMNTATPWGTGKEAYHLTELDLLGLKVCVEQRNIGAILEWADQRKISYDAKWRNMSAYLDVLR